MRDGVVLVADVYRPDVPGGRFPVLLNRLPYGKGSSWWRNVLDPLLAVRAGFAVVVQDTRGCHGSDGEWQPFVHEAEDGADTVAWATHQTWSDGRVGMFGASYHAFTQWAAAGENPEGLCALAPSFGFARPPWGDPERRQLPELGAPVLWSLQMELAAALRRGEVASAESSALAEAIDALAPRGYERAWAERKGGTRARRGRGVEEPSSAVARQTDPLATARVPALLIGGWYDCFLSETFAAYAQLLARRVDVELLVGPWTHLDRASPIGELNFGLAAEWSPIEGTTDLSSLQLEWFRRWMPEPGGTATPGATAAARSGATSPASHPRPGRTRPGGPASDRPATPAPPGRAEVFVMGRNRWHTLDVWPPQGLAELSLYLRAGGLLSEEVPGRGEPRDELLFDPDDLVPTVGGPTLLSPEFRAGPCDQQPLAGRADVVAYRTGPLSGELVVEGSPVLDLWLHLGPLGADVIAQLLDVHQDGRAFPVAEGSVRLGPGERGEPASAPGTPGLDGPSVLHRLALGPTSVALAPGHRVGLQLASSSFPRWEPLASVPPASGPSCSAIVHDRAHPSSLRLPAWPRRCPAVSAGQGERVP